MIDNLPVHVRISTLNPSNDDVDARRSTIAQLSTAWAKLSDVDKILGKAKTIADSISGDGTPYDDLGDEVQAAMQKRASAFLYEESPLDVGICAGMAALSILGGALGVSGWTIADVYSNALWSAIGFQPSLAEEKRERLRREVLELAQKRSRAAADKARERGDVPDMPDLTVTIADESKVSTSFKKATGATIEALRRNAALDREELDFLWWAQLGCSRLLKRPIGTMPEPLRLVASGIEAATHLRRLPADVHYDIVLRTLDKDPAIDLKELIDALGGDRAALAGSFNTTRVTAHSEVFPLLSTLVTGETKVDGFELKRKTSEWAGRALLEAGLNRMCDRGVMKL